MAAKKAAVNDLAQRVFTREQALASKKYRPYCDVLGVVLEDGRQYTAREIETIKENFLKRPVKEQINGEGKRACH